MELISKKNKGKIMKIMMNELKPFVLIYLYNEKIDFE